MSTLAILLCILGAWWLLLAAFLLRDYIQQPGEPGRALSLDKLVDHRELEACISKKRGWLHDYFIAPSFTIALAALLFPLYLYVGFLERTEPHPDTADSSLPSHDAPDRHALSANPGESFDDQSQF